MMDGNSDGDNDDPDNQVDYVMVREGLCGGKLEIMRTR